MAEKNAANEDKMKNLELLDMIDERLEQLAYMGSERGRPAKPGSAAAKAKAMAKRGAKPTAAAYSGRAAGARDGAETRDCHWCQRKGHLKADCRIFKA